MNNNRWVARPHTIAKAIEATLAKIANGYDVSAVKNVYDREKFLQVLTPMRVEEFNLLEKLKQHEH